MKTRWGHWLLLCGLAGITVTADRQRGGHVLDCRLIKGQACLDLTPVFTLQLPEKGFGRLELSGSHARELKAVEQ